VRLAVRTVQEMVGDDTTHMAAGVAYYVLFSLFPLLLGLIALMTLFLDDPAVRLQFTQWVTGYLPGSEQLVTANLRAISSFRQALGIFAIIGLFWSGSGIFGAITRAVNRAWDVHEDRPIYISKPRQLLMALFTGVLFALSISSAAIVRAAGDLAALQIPAVQTLVNTGTLVLLQGTSFLLVLSIFLLIYKFLPNTRTYWRYIWPGALVGAVLFELAKNLFIFYLNTFASFENVYGSLAPVIALLLWTYVSSLILILGAELSSEYGRLRRGLDRGSLIARGEAK
jgi:membrane protein